MVEAAHRAARHFHYQHTNMSTNNHHHHATTDASVPPLDTAANHHAIAEGDADGKPHHHGGHAGQHPHNFKEKLSFAVDSMENKIEDAAKYVGELVAGKESGSAHEF